MPSSESPPESESACRVCGGVLLESSGGVCIRCSSIGEVQFGDPGNQATELMPRHDEQSPAGAKCARCGVSLGSVPSADSWCEQCLEPVARPAAAPDLPSAPPFQVPGYRMLRPLGRGGMGVVWLAEQRATKQTVAIKFCLEDRFSPGPGSPALRRFEREMELAARLSHPHIARVFGGGDIEGLPYCVMEYVEGADLADYVRTHHLDRKAVVALLSTVAEAVQHAHQNGIIHRDLKPSNVLVNPQGEPKVVDFGLAKALEGTEGASLELSLAGQFLGTPRYMAPEQVRGTAVDTRTDVYALGVILCELLTGAHPHESTGSREAFLHRIATDEPRRPRTLCRDLDAELEMLLLKTLSKAPADRYRTAGELADDLARWLRSEPLTAGRATPLYFARKWLVRHRAVALVTAGVVLALVTATAFYIDSIRRSKKETETAKGLAEGRLTEVQAAQRKSQEQVREASRVSVGVARDQRENSHRPRTALAHLAKALEYDPDSSRAALEAMSQLIRNPENSGAWQFGEPQSYDLSMHSAEFSSDGRWVVTACADKTARVWDAATGKPVGEPLRHEDQLLSAAFSPDGHRVVTVCRDNTARIWDAATGLPIGEPLRHKAIARLAAFGPKGIVQGAVFSPDGRRVVTTNSDYAARIWDAATGKPIGEPLAHEPNDANFKQFDPTAANSAAFSSDGRWVVTASDDKTARVWDAATGKPVGEPLRHEDHLRSVEFSPDGRWAVTASRDKTARVWDAAIGKPVGEPLRHEGRVSSATFSPDGRWVLTASDDKTARVWDAATGKPIGEPLRHENSVWSATFSPDGRRVVTASYDNTARVWDAATGKPVGEPLRHEDYVRRAMFSPDGRRVVTASGDKTARVWDAVSGKLIGEPLRHEDSVWSATFSPDGRRVVTTSRGSARIWAVVGGKPIAVALRHEYGLGKASFSPDGLSVVTTPYNAHTARIWNAVTGETIGKPLRHEDSVRSAAFSPDGHWVVTASKDKTARVWDAATGKPIGEPLRHDKSVTTAAFSPDGRWVVTASFDKTARIWDVATGRPIGEPLRHQDSVWSAAFSPDGRRVVTAGWSDKTGRIWDAATGNPIGELLRHEDSVGSAAFSPDGRMVVTASEDKTARVWDAATGKPIGEPLRHENSVESAAFSPDGRWVVTASEDKTARVWDAATGKPMCEPLRHEDGVLSAAFSPDGRWVVTAGRDKTARIWDAATGRPIGEPLRHEDLVWKAAFSPDGRWVVAGSGNGIARVWDAGIATTGAPGWLPGFLTTLAGREITSDGAERLLSAKERRLARDELMAMPNDGSEWQRIMRWHFSDPRTRTISPNSPVNISDHMDREIERALSHGEMAWPENGQESRAIVEEAYALNPSHPLIHFALAAFEKDKVAADFLRAFGLKHLPADAPVCQKAAAILSAQGAPVEAAEAVRRASRDGKVLDRPAEFRAR